MGTESVGQQSATVNEGHRSTSKGSDERLLRLPEVEKKTGLKKSSIYAGMRKGSFPKCVRFGRVVAWPASRIEQWLAELVSRSDAGKQTDLLQRDGRSA